MNGTYADLLKLAAAEVGYQENPTRHGVQKYSEALGLPYTEWCAIFASWLLRNAAVPGAPVSTRVTLLAQHYAGQGRLSRAPRVGAFACFDWGGDGAYDHIGLVVGVGTSTVDTIEGNTTPRNSTRTGVYRMRRNTRTIRSYILPAYRTVLAVPAKLVTAGANGIQPDGRWPISYPNPAPTYDARSKHWNECPTVGAGGLRADKVRGGWVTYVQSKLGMPATNGYCGPNEVAAIRRWQHTKGYAATGAISGIQWTSLGQPGK